ncbi:MAG TPA: cyclase family protein [Chroococcales cyanobacterium]
MAIKRATTGGKLKQPYRFIDISQPVTSTTACFPGDVPFSRQITVSHKESNVINLTALTMSPHVGTHIDAPVHVRGTMESGEETVGALPLAPFFGPVTVLDLAPCDGAISAAMVAEKLTSGAPIERLLIKTANQIRYHVFEEKYAYFATDLVAWMAEQGIVLAGLDTPSVDHTQSKTLDAHHHLLKHNIVWLENLDLTDVVAGEYLLVAFPVKFMELEASPVRAVLLELESEE